MRRAFAGTAFSIVISLVLVELGARVWLAHFASDEQLLRYGTLDDVRERSRIAGKPLYKFEPHRYLGYVPAPGFERGKNRHNRWGYRGEDFPKFKPAGEFRIVCLGGSTTYTSFVEDSDQSYPALLEKTLHDRGFEHVRVINAGTPGWTSYESLINFQFRVLDLKPDLIIVYHALNDVVTRLVYPFRFYQTDNSGHLQHSPGWSRPVAVWDRSVPLRMVRIHLGHTPSMGELRNVFATPAKSSRFVQFHLQGRTGRYPSQIFEKYPVRALLEKNRPVAFRRNISNLLASASLNRVRVVLATFAVHPGAGDANMRFGLAHPEFLEGVAQHNAIIQEIGQRLNVPVFDFASAFPKERELFFDPVHVTAKGSEVKARLFATYLLSNGLVPAAVN